MRKIKNRYLFSGVIGVVSVLLSALFINASSYTSSVVNVSPLVTEAASFSQQINSGSLSPASVQALTMTKAIEDSLISYGILAPNCGVLAATEPTLSPGVYNFYPSSDAQHSFLGYCAPTGNGSGNPFLTFWLNPMSLPSGSYFQSCSACQVINNVLSCTCGNSSGGNTSTTLNVSASNCGTGDITNSNGNLTCSNSGNLPTGSYQQSCSSCLQSQNILFCNCADANGDSAPTSLNVSALSCGSGDVGNSNGALTCANSSNLPSGSYEQTCNSCSMNGNTLACKCASGSGQSTNTTLNVDAANCGSGDIWNAHGSLSCAKTGSLPSGSYQQSCSSCQFNGNTLSCLCKNNSGLEVNTSINATAANCGTADIADNNGTLACSNPHTLPSGSYQQSCSSCQFNGNTLSCLCKNNSGLEVNTSINATAANCGTADIADNNGTLACSNPHTLPSGSYQQSCSSCQLNGNSLSCNCLNSTGQNVAATLNTSIQNCGIGPIANSNGTLTCPVSPIPALMMMFGSYLENK